MQNDLRIESHRWQKDADSLIQESSLISGLSKFGTPDFTGSYKYQLMLDGDIDIYLITPNANKKTAKHLIDELINQGFWNGYMLFDWVNFRRDYFPEAYYVGMKTDYKGHKWKVDIWVLDQFPPTHKEYNDWLEGHLNESNREIILRLKAARKDKGWTVDGKTIYDAVIKEGISTIDDFENRLLK